MLSAILSLAVLGRTVPADASGWPKTSHVPASPLRHPLLESGFPSTASGAPGKISAEVTPACSPGFRFVAFGDQRALADGEWQQMIRKIVLLERREGAFAFVLDTGDIVEDGTHSDQFARLHTILEPLAHLPYLVAVGNHELNNNGTPQSRENTARFLSYLDPALADGHFYYRKDLGTTRLLFLDTNQLVYGVEGEREECPPTIEPGTPAGRQFAWLVAQLALGAGEAPNGRSAASTAVDTPARTIVILHHPFVQSSKKHRPQGRSLWNATYEGRRLADILADAGVDLVLTGHTHTYERFRLTREDGQSFSVVNLSGRPRNDFLWFGAKARRARDIRGVERERLRDWGWTDVDRWQIKQEEVMLKRDEANQFGVFEVTTDGEIHLETFFVDKDEDVTPRRTGIATLAPATDR